MKLKAWVTWCKQYRVCMPGYACQVQGRARPGGPYPCYPGYVAGLRAGVGYVHEAGLRAEVGYVQEAGFPQAHVGNTGHEPGQGRRST